MGNKFEQIPQEPVEEKEEKKVTRRDFLKTMGKIAVGGAIIASGLDKGVEALAEQEKKDPKIEQIKEDWTEFKQVVKESKVRDNIKFLEQTYGSIADGMVFQLKNNLQLFDQLVNEEKNGVDLTNEKNKDLLKASIEEYHTYWDQGFFDETVRKAENKEGLSAKIEGFERIEGMDNEKVQELLEDNFNKRWLYGNTSSFEYVDELKSRKTFDVAGEAHTEGLVGIFYKSGKEKIKIYKNEGMKDEERLLEIMSHEIGHHQDWENSNRLPLQDRLQFLREVTERLGSSDRFHSSYVEIDIPCEYSDYSPQEIKYIQAIEYWAVMVENYDRHGEDLKKNKLEDYELVDKWRGKAIKKP